MDVQINQKIFSQQKMGSIFLADITWKTSILYIEEKTV